MSNADPVGTLLGAIFLVCVPIYLVVGVAWCLSQARGRARQGRFTGRWAWGAASVLVGAPALLLGALVARDLVADAASGGLTLLLCGVPLVPVLIWTVQWWLKIASGSHGPTFTVGKRRAPGRPSQPSGTPRSDSAP